jgi:putative ABC transport system permease protein
MGIGLVRGRLFDDRDGPGAPLALIVSETAARELWPGLDPLGRRARIGASDTPWRSVVGVVGDVRHEDLATAPTPQMYLPQAQLTDSMVVLAVKAAPDAPASLLESTRRAVREVHPGVPVYDVATMEERVGRALAERRFVMRLLGAFAATSLLLAAVGLYGVVSYSVARRTRELGLRLALGATRGDIVRLILAGGLPTLALGIGGGLAGAAALTRFTRTLLFEVRPGDPLTLGLAVLVLAAVVAAAHGLPVRRALRGGCAAARRCPAPAPGRSCCARRTGRRATRPGPSGN